MTERPKLTAIDGKPSNDVVEKLERAVEAAKSMRAYSAFVVLVGPDKTYIANCYPGNGKLVELVGQVEYEKQIMLRDAINADGR